MNDMVIIRDFTEDECWEMLRAHSFGRLAYHLRGRSQIAPINYVLDGSRLIFRTAEGSKFFAVAADSDVAFEIDQVDPDTASSVVALGVVRELEDPDEVAQATSELRPWVPTVKKHVFAIEIDELSGRSFQLDR